MSRIPIHRITALLPALLLGLSLALLLAVAWLAYLPGLHGAFLLDDYISLSGLGAYGPVDNWNSFLRYVTSGTADPIGRPLALASFLIDAQNWPADAEPFMHTNVLLHLLNGLLLFWAMLELGTDAGLPTPHNRKAALSGTSIWLLHPLFVSTTLYTVQRETMLQSAFAFTALILWSKGRKYLNSDRIIPASLLMGTGSLLGTFLASLCKASGVLLPLLIAVSESTILRSQSNKHGYKSPWHRFLYAGTLGVPLLLLVVVLIAEIPASIHIADTSRPWSVGQRLLSEPRMLMQYLWLLWVPRSMSFGVFNDQFHASTGWLAPCTTLPCLLAIAGLLGIGWGLRRRQPIVAYAILFYFAGHLLESTFIPLELAFEHRNYLPAAFLFWPLGVWLTGTGPRLRRIRSVAVICIPAALATLTWNRCQIWGDPRLQGMIWARINPNSARAQALAGNMESFYGNHLAAVTRLRTAVKKMPDEVQLTVNLVLAECATGSVMPQTWDATVRSFALTTSNPSSMYPWLADIIEQARRRSCAGLSLQGINNALNALRGNPRFSRQPAMRNDAEFIAGRLALAESEPGKALQHFDNALNTIDYHQRALIQAALLADAGYPDAALEHLSYAETYASRAQVPPLSMSQVHNWILERQNYWGIAFAKMRAVLSADIKRPRANVQ